jgi:two-component system, sensor histidine kinase and response regulator
MAKILVVDDDAGVREVIRLTLEAEGYRVIEAEDGDRGVELASAEVPELILCDVRMGRMDGYGMLSMLRRNSVTASLPVILMTGQADPEGMRQGMELGADDYLPKPFKVDQLLAAVEARLRKHRAMQEQAERRMAELRANISLSLPHELLTPLNGILGFADLLATDASSMGGEEIGSMAGAIRESAERLHRLIQNFLLLAHLELHRGELEFPDGVLRLGDLRCRVDEMARAVASRHGRLGDLQLSTQGISARTRDDYWSKIVEEVVDNAFKFSTPGSRVVVELARKGPVGVMRVRDLGRGMKPEHVAEVGAYMQFERRFYEQQGSGLGLTIAKRLVELLGGRLTISSALGGGTAVEVEVPTAVNGESEGLEGLEGV